MTKTKAQKLSYGRSAIIYPNEKNQLNESSMKYSTLVSLNLNAAFVSSQEIAEYTKVSHNKVMEAVDSIKKIINVRAKKVPKVLPQKDFQIFVVNQFHKNKYYLLNLFAVRLLPLSLFKGDFLCLHQFAKYLEIRHSFDLCTIGDAVTYYYIHFEPKACLETLGKKFMTWQPCKLNNLLRAGKLITANNLATPYESRLNINTYIKMLNMDLSYEDACKIADLSNLMNDETNIDKPEDYLLTKSQKSNIANKIIDLKNIYNYYESKAEKNFLIDISKGYVEHLKLEDTILSDYMHFEEILDDDNRKPIFEYYLGMISKNELRDRVSITGPDHDKAIDYFLKDLNKVVDDLCDDFFNYWLDRYNIKR